MLFGAQVRQAGGLFAALRRAEAMGAEVWQLFAQSPRQWRTPSRDPEHLAAVREAHRTSTTVARVVCHAPYLINLGSCDAEVQDRSRRCLADNLAASARLGAAGLVVHLGSHLGLGLEARLPAIAGALLEALDSVWSDVPGCPILLENTAGAGATIGRTFEELALVIEAAGGDERLGVCLDSQHLWASGIPFRTPREADSVVRRLDRAVGLDRLACLHLNDSKVGLGENRDRHENLARGAIGAGPLRALLGQPRLQGLPVVLEVPGEEGHGPGAADLAVARRLHAEGLTGRRRGVRRD